MFAITTGVYSKMYYTIGISHVNRVKIVSHFLKDLIFDFK